MEQRDRDRRSRFTHVPLSFRDIVHTYRRMWGRGSLRYWHPPYHGRGRVARQSIVAARSGPPVKMPLLD